MAKTKNYQQLTDTLCDIFDAVNNDEIALEKANTLVNTANAITSIQRSKIASTRVTGDKKIKFFED